MPYINVREKLREEFFTSVFKFERVKTDTAIFRLHYKLAPIVIIVVILLFILVGFSNSSYVSCVFSSNTDSSGSKDDVNSYCFILSTFTVALRNDMTQKEIDLMIKPKELSPGLRPLTSPKDRATYHRYYFWIPFMLMIQFGLFYFPRYVWYNYEAGRIKMLTSDLTGVVVDPEGRKNKKKMVAEYLFAGWGYQQMYAVVFAICEVLNLATVSVQMIFLHRISGGRFSTISFEWVASMLRGGKPDNDMLLRGFPLTTHCVMNVYGPGGNIVPHSGICNLTLNMMTQKYFISMWFFLSFLWICDIGTIVFRMVSLFRPKLRQSLLQWRACLAPEKVIRELVKNAQYGDWFLLYQLAMVMDAPAFADILVDLLKRIEDSKIPQ